MRFHVRVELSWERIEFSVVDRHDFWKHVSLETKYLDFDSRLVVSFVRRLVVCLARTQSFSWSVIGSGLEANQNITQAASVGIAASSMCMQGTALVIHYLA